MKLFILPPPPPKFKLPLLLSPLLSLSISLSLSIHSNFSFLFILEGEKSTQIISIIRRLDHLIPPGTIDVPAFDQRDEKQGEADAGPETGETPVQAEGGAKGDG